MKKAVKILLIAWAITAIAIGLTVWNDTKTVQNTNSQCKNIGTAVPSYCVDTNTRLCKNEDGNTDGKECWWVNDGKVWYIDGSEYRN